MRPRLELVRVVDQPYVQPEEDSTTQHRRLRTQTAAFVLLLCASAVLLGLAWMAVS